MGYHYPRSLVTAFRSFANFPKFIKDFEKAIKKMILINIILLQK